jgi:hypothetical protein
MIEVSNGELIDRYTILTIKYSKLTDETAFGNVTNERNELTQMLEKLIDSDENIFNLEIQLFRVNEMLWDIEDKLRLKERDGEFDNEFIELARSVYKLNDERARLKREINDITKSNIVEEKSYAKWD